MLLREERAFSSPDRKLNEWKELLTARHLAASRAPRPLPPPSALPPRQVPASPWQCGPPGQPGAWSAAKMAQ